MEAVTWGFIGTVIGAVASIATTAITNWGSYALAQKSKAHEREELAKAFQRETLLELQTELLEYIRTCSQAYCHDRKNYKDTGVWGGSIPDEINLKNQEHSAKTSILVQRIADEQLRKQLAELKDNATKCLLADNKYDAGAYYASFSDSYQTSNEMLGQVLRDTYQTSNA